MAYTDKTPGELAFELFMEERKAAELEVARNFRIDPKHFEDSALTLSAMKSAFMAGRYSFAKERCDAAMAELSGKEVA